MTDNRNIKIYKNPARSKPEKYKPYIPQHQVHGIEPVEYKSPVAPGVTLAVQQTPHAPENVRKFKPARQPYAESVVSPIGRGLGVLPNVGNNVEQTWSSVDSEIVDDISDIDLNHPMIDNNDFVGEVSFEATNKTSFADSDAADDSVSILETIRDLEEDSYLLMVYGETVCSGPLQYIEEQTTALVFGEHELYLNNPISTDDIIVIKKVKLKVGVFLV